MKVLVVGASGIVGQHMRLCVPEGVEPVWVRRESDPITEGCELQDDAARAELLARIQPDVIVNLAGESRVDVVERDPNLYHYLNFALPDELLRWCQQTPPRLLIHISTQGVLAGDQPPYHPEPAVIPAVNAYGRQKQDAENNLLAHGSRANLRIIRLTTVLGIRPLPLVGRPNPVELMLAGNQQLQTDDRWFSPLFARDAARQIWRVVEHPENYQTLIHCGIASAMTRYRIAEHMGADSTACDSDAFPGIAPRPVDTSFAAGTTYFGTTLTEGVLECLADWRDYQESNFADRAREIAPFLGLREDAAKDRLGRGFAWLHGQVAEDFRRAAPQSDEALLDWYRRTEAYIWELSAYHCEPGFNYNGLCEGLGARLRASGAKRVLCLGDGIGDLTLSLWRAGLAPTYHDLAGSRTAEFAQFRFWRHTGQYLAAMLTEDWKPRLQGRYDAVVALDFLEHVTDVPAWTAAIREVLEPGGLFFAQNAFGIGSGPEGSIPMHLARNDRYQDDWRGLLADLRFADESGNWWRRAA